MRGSFFMPHSATGARELSKESAMIGRFWTLSGRVLFVVLAGLLRLAWGQAPVDACTLLTQAQVSKVIGTQVGVGGGFASRACSWYAPSTTGIPQGVTLIVYPRKK